MSDYYSVTVRVLFGVIANSQEEAEELADSLCPIDDAPVQATISIDAYRTPNQADHIRAKAANN